MNRTPETRATGIFFIARATRVLAAAGFYVGAVFALAGLPAFRDAAEPEHAAAAPRIAVEPAPALLVYHYYPEQLAALQSLGQFQPIADAGNKPTPQAVAVVAAPKAVDPEARPVRRLDQPSKFAVAPVAAPAAPAVTAPAPESAKIFGLPLPAASLPYAAEIGGHFAALRDTAAHWGETAAGLSGSIASLWR
jgi:hypothetical protein